MLLIGWMFIALIFKGHRRSNVSPFYTDNMRLCYSHLLKWSRYNMYRTNAQRPDPFFRCDLDLIICHNLGSLIQLFDGTFNPLAWFCQWSRKFHWNPTRIDRDIAFFMRFHAFWHVRFWNKRILYILYIYIPWNGKEPRVDKQFRRCVLSLERKIGKEEEFRVSWGSEFHSRGPMTEKALCQKIFQVWIYGMERTRWLCKLRMWRKEKTIIYLLN